MNQDYRAKRAMRWIAGGAVVMAAACGGDIPPAQRVLPGPSKSGTIDISSDDKFVAMVNPEDDSVSIFDTETNTLRAKVQTGDEPVAIAITPYDAMFVANRADATVVKITGLETAEPKVVATVDVGSEPVAIALSPTGRTIYVAEHAEGRISVIDADSMTIKGVIDEPHSPRAIAVTNDLDEAEIDETIVVTEFFGEPVGTEGTDTSRRGRIRLYNASDLKSAGSIELNPLDSGFAPVFLDTRNPIPGAPVVMTSPNQLWAVQIVKNKIYIPSISVSPAPPLSFPTNVQPVVYVADLATKREDRGPLGTMNLAKLIDQQVPATGLRVFAGDIVDTAFIGDETMYVVARGGEIIQRVELGAQGPKLGSDKNKQIDLLVKPEGSQKVCQNPIGIVTVHQGSTAYVNCWVSRSLGVVDLSDQKLDKVVESAPVPAAEQDIQLGRHFYFTGRGRWSGPDASRSGWSSCGSCHPDGLTDNVTWIFGTGPRQSTSMDGSFSKAVGRPQVQRIFNWSGIFDEIHDFDRNTRETSGGLGAITKAVPGGTCGDLTKEVAKEDQIKDGLLNPVKEVQDQSDTCVKDFDKIEAFARTIRPPRALRFLDKESVARGAALFGARDVASVPAAGCVKCHGGPGWTASRRFFTPSSVENAELAGLDATGKPISQPGPKSLFLAPSGFPQSNTATSWNFHTLHIAKQPKSPKHGNEIVFPGIEADTEIAGNQVACALRNVGTFGSDDLEQRAILPFEKPKPPLPKRAQGRLGYNIPSLYGLALGAPYLHHGGALDLVELFDDPAWENHAVAGSSVWLRQGTPEQIAQRKQDLINFLLSIDANTPVQELPSDVDACRPTSAAK